MTPIVPSAPPPRRLIRWTASPSLIVARGFGLGLSPMWPGTLGSLLGIPLAWMLRDLAPIAAVAVYGVAFIVGVYVCHRAGQRLGDPDHRSIVIDEVVGAAVALHFSPSGLGWMLAAFVAFRLFDSIKPWPISVVHARMNNAGGAMLDDLLAALAAAACLQGAAHAFS